MLPEINAILNDRESGSLALLNRLIEALDVELGIKGLELEAFLSDLAAIRKELKHFAAIENFLASLILFTSQKGAFPGEALQFIREYRFYWKDSSRKIAENFLGHCDPRGRTILTHSHSQTLISLLDQLQLKQVPFRVLQTLSHPGEEGRISYERMCGLKIQATLIDDGNLKEALAHTDLILLGCDALLDKKFLNKIGTRSILEEARHFDINSILITETRKKITDPAWEKAITGLKLFEWVPLDMLDMILTESWSHITEIQKP